MSATDFLTAFRDHGLVNDPNVAAKALDHPVIFVAPLGTAVPDDGLLDYVTFDNAIDFLQSAKDGGMHVVLVREDQQDMLRVMCENANLFGVDIKAIYGVPESDYRPWFDEATFQAERVSYSPFVSELRIAKDVIDMQERERPKRTIEKEESSFVRKTGKVKEMNKDDIVVGDEEGEEDA